MSLRVNVKRIAKIIAGLLAVVLVTIPAFPTGRYLLRAGWEEGRILLRRRPIVALVADSTVASPVRSRLRLVLDARAFAESTLGLRTGESFTTYSRLDSDTLVLVLSAAYRDRLEAFTWWFPIVGRVPYKGYFDFAGAEKAREQLAARGFDTYLRPASAFSTLGWFNDPLLSTTLSQDSLSLANTVIHELSHNTLFVPGAAEFNESFASFVGARGAAALFRARGSEAAALRVELRWEDDKRLGDFWSSLARALDSAYSEWPGDSAARVSARDSVYSRGRRILVDSLAPLLPTFLPERLERIQLDNAALLARRVYARDLGLFDNVLRRHGDLPATIALVRRLVEGADDPFAAVDAWMASAPGGAPPDVEAPRARVGQSRVAPPD